VAGRGRKVNVKIKVTVSEPLKRKLSELKALRRIAIPQAADDTVNWLRRYHTRFRQDWQGPRYMAGPRSNLFWQQVVAGWQDPVISGSRVTITNTFGLLAWKVSGGTIEPIRAQMLTIPLIPSAKGLTAAEWKAEEGLPLFRVGNALMTRVGKNLQGVYALKQSVTQAPWPGAMPPNEEIRQVFNDSIRTQLKTILNK
jgi:hypothetical protein